MRDTSKETLDHVLAFYRQAAHLAPARATIDLDDGVQIIVARRRALREGDE